MDAVLEAIFRVILPAAVGIAAVMFVIIGLARRAKPSPPEQPRFPEPYERKRMKHSLGPLFARLRVLGVEVWAQTAPFSQAPFRVVMVVGHESVYMCSCCGQRGKYAFGETVEYGRALAKTVWLGHACGHCGFVDRYRDGRDGGGFFSATLEHGSTLLDVVTALEAQAGPTLAHRVQAVLAEREAILMARGNVLRALRYEIAAVTGASPTHPFRGSGGDTTFKA